MTSTLRVNSYWTGILTIHLFSLFQLRLLYECNPMAFIITQAGGKATTGVMNVLDVQPEAIHQRVPIFLGSTDDVNDVEACFQKYA